VHFNTLRAQHNPKLLLLMIRKFTTKVTEVDKYYIKLTLHICLCQQDWWSHCLSQLQ